MLRRGKAQTMIVTTQLVGAYQQLVEGARVFGMRWMPLWGSQLYACHGKTADTNIGCTLWQTYHLELFKQELTARMYGESLWSNIIRIWTGVGFSWQSRYIKQKAVEGPRAFPDIQGSQCSTLQAAGGDISTCLPDASLTIQVLDKTKF